MISRKHLFLKILRRGFDPGQIATWLALREALDGCDSILDVGCGSASNLGLLECSRLTGIEGYAPSYETAKEKGTHDDLILGDVRQLDQLFKPNQFDGCIAIDVIEHLTKEEGQKLARDMERIATRKVVFFTPGGFLPQHHTENDDLQVHLSGWEPADMRAMGYEVSGMLGPRRFRTEHHVLRLKPKFFWGIVSIAAHLLWTRTHPEAAAALLATKVINRSRK